MKNQEKTKEDTTDSEIALDVMSRNKLVIFAQSAFYTLVMIGLLGSTGYYLDHYLGTKPVFMIILLVVSYPLTQYLIYKQVTKFTQKTLSKAKKK